MVSRFEFADHVVGVLIESDMNEEIYLEIRDMIKAKITEFQKISLFLEIEKGHDVSFSAVIKHLKFSVEFSKHFKKIAVVTDKRTFKNALILKDHLIDAEVRSFAYEDRLEAIQWIAE